MKRIRNLLIVMFLAIFAMQHLTAQPPMPFKEKQLTLKVFLQGFYDAGTGQMNQCMIEDGVTPKFSGTTVDTIYVELRSATDYTTIVHTATAINLNQNGTAVTPGKTYISIPAAFNGSYYITVRTRNHLETTTAAPVSFATTTINYDFTTAATQAYGSNMMLKGTAYCLYAGDINQDGVINNAGDVATVFSNVLNGSTGFIISDVNGDGIVVVSGDVSTVFSNVLSGIIKLIP